jgi:chromosome segregation ATPase
MRNRLLVLLVALTAAAATVLSARETLNYIYRRGDRTYMRSDGDGLANLKALEKRYGSEFVWVRMDGKGYVIGDPSVLASVREIFAELDRLEAPMHQVEQRMKPHEREMERIESRLDAVTDQYDDEDLSDSRRQTLEAKMHDLEEEMHQVEKQMSGVEREMEKLEREMEKHEAVVEARFEEAVTRAIRAGKAQRLD